MTIWHTDSWCKFAATQLLDYSDKLSFNIALRQLAKVNPLTNYNSIHSLLNNLAQVHAKKAFILQAGDCAERFTESDFASKSTR